jgi:tetratricopeptide (TPR) repeat protein
VWAAAPFFLVAGLASLIEVAGQTLVSGGTPAIADTLAARVARAGWMVWFYLSKAVLPVHLSFVYPRWEIDASRMVAWLPLLGLAACLAAAWRARHGRGRPLLCALLYYLLLLSPVLGFFDVFYMRYSFVADHYQYLALAGIVALLVGVAGSVLEHSRIPRAVQLAAAIALVSACTFASARQSADYRDAETLWRSALARNPGSFLAHYNLGHLLQAQSRLEGAAHEYQAALRIRPDDALAHNNLGKIALDRGHPVAAVRHYRRALESDPDLLEARNNLAVVLQQQGRLEDALLEYGAALQRAPDSAEVHYNVARLLERLGRLDEAVDHYRRVLEIDPAADYARSGLERALAARAAAGSGS